MPYRGKQPRDFLAEIKRGNWKLLTKAETKGKNFGPDKVFINVHKNETLIFLKRSDSGGFSISQNTITYYSHMMRNGNCCYVGLFEQDGTMIDHDIVTSVERATKNHEPIPSNRSDWPHYFWLKEDFNVSDPTDFFVQNLVEGRHS
jgi:hypothetical protein